MYQIGDVLRGPRTGDLYVLINKSKASDVVRLRKVWVNPACSGRRVTQVGDTTTPSLYAMHRMTLVGRNYQEKAK
jgi:hypothetical protein